MNDDVKERFAKVVAARAERLGITEEEVLRRAEAEVALQESETATTCKFCGGPTVLNPEICQKCFPALHAVQDINAAVLENIIRFVHLERFKKEQAKKKR